MDRQQILLAKALEAAKAPLDVSTFNDRLILQKTVYLLQSAGINIRYRFRWYLRGPYSPDMTAGAFGIVNEGENGNKELKGWKLDEDSVKLAAKLQPLLHKAGESKLATVRRLELLASVLFLVKTGQAKVNDPSGTSSILKKNDKDYDADEVKDAVKQLRSYDLLT